MRTIERISLYVLVALCTFNLLERAGADDDKAGAGAAAPGVIEATRIDLKNEKGEVVLQLTVAQSGGGEMRLMNAKGHLAARLYARSDHDGELQLRDVEGVLRTTIGANDEGGYANFFNRKGDLACYVGADEGHERGYVALYGEQKGKVLELLGHEKGGLLKVHSAAGRTEVAAFGAGVSSGAGELALAGTSGEVGLKAACAGKGGLMVLRNLESKKPVTVLGTAPDTGTGVFVLNSAAGTLGLQLHVSEHGGQFAVLNAAAKKVGFMGVSASPAGNGLLYVARDDGNRLWEAGRNSSRGGYMSVRNGDGKRVVFLGSTTGDQADDGVLEVSTRAGGLGVVLRGHGPQSSVRVYDAAGKVKNSMR